MPDAHRLGAIDAGSNAIRMVIADAADPAALQRIDAERAPVRLGRGAFTRGELDAHLIDDAVDAFVRFREKFEQHGVSRYRAVATSAVRSADNRDVLLHRLYHEAGIELEVIDGEEEARLVRKAVLHAFEGRTPPRIVLDLGGGSLEVTVRRGASWTGRSLPVGTVRLVETFGLTGAIGPEEAGMVRRYTATLLQTMLAGVSPDPEIGPELGPDTAPAAACGGNVEALARLLPAEVDGMAGFELSALETALPDILGADVDERMRRFGVRRDRAEVMAVAALVLSTVCRALKIRRLEAPGVGVRDALLLELAERAAREKARADDALGKALLTAARTFAGRVGHDTAHGDKVAQLSRSIFDQLTDLHEMPGELGIALEIAALLHDVGEVVHTRSHHKHSEYLIRHGRIPGLDGPMRDLVALLVRTHRKTPPNADRHPDYAAMPPQQRDHVRKLSAILRLADGLDTEHRQTIEHVHVSRLGDEIALDLIVSPEAAGEPSHAPGDASDAGDEPIDPALLLRKATMFEQEFRHRVTFTVGSPGLPGLPLAGSFGVVSESPET